MDSTLQDFVHHNKMTTADLLTIVLQARHLLHNSYSTFECTYQPCHFFHNCECIVYIDNLNSINTGLYIERGHAPITNLSCIRNPYPLFKIVL